MANKRIIDLKTGKDTVIPLTPDEDAAAAARTAAELVDPVRADIQAQQQLSLETKALVMFKALEKASLAQIDTWVDTNFSGMTAQQRAFLKMVAAGVALYLREL